MVMSYIICSSELTFENLYPGAGSDTVLGWLRLIGSVKLHVSFAKEFYKKGCILQKRCVI